MEGLNLSKEVTSSILPEGLNLSKEVTSLVLQGMTCQRLDQFLIVEFYEFYQLWFIPGLDVTSTDAVLDIDNGNDNDDNNSSSTGLDSETTSKRW